MQMPNIRNTLRDTKYNVTYHIMAYRQLTYTEKVQSVAAFHSQPKNRRRKTPLRNLTVTILTVFGATPNL